MFNLFNRGEEMVRKREAGVENVLCRPQDRTGNHGNERGGTFFFNSSVSQRPQRAILEEMTILGYSSVDTDPEGNS